MIELPQKDWRSELERIMRGSGDILLKYFGTDMVRILKKQQGFFTDADLASERYLIDELGKLFPQAAIIAEESGISGEGDYRWVIDPLDGTTNFAHGLDYFCVSVALTHNDVPVIGAIFNPSKDEFFYAQHGQGAFLNGSLIAVTQEREKGKNLIALGLPYSNDKRLPLLKAANAVAVNAFGIRHFGAAALDLAHVACGRLDGIFFSHLGWWDVAAGMILILEAGGVVTDFNGDSIGPNYVSCMGGGVATYKMLRKALNK